jgi:hypothetical protein
MGDRDLFNSRIILLLVERKNQNDILGPTRWLGHAFKDKRIDSLGVDTSTAHLPQQRHVY